MKCTLVLCLIVVGLPLTSRAEQLGSVAFSNSCSAAVNAPFNRGIALLHDFWYEEALKQFDDISKADPNCALAHWGKAMSEYHQIWNRPNEETMAQAWGELEKSHSPQAKTEREREYIAALSEFFHPGKQSYQTRVEAYSAAMGKLYARYPDDVDAGAFYALSLLAAQAPNDTSLANQEKALAVLNPLFEKNPDHPGLAHYIIHTCDTPSLAQQGLEAARRYGDIAPSAPHAVHMPGHIFARLGMWQQDIKVNQLSVAASKRAEALHLSGVVDQLHADDFLLYAYLQSGQDLNARNLVAQIPDLLDHLAGNHLTMHGMDGMFAAYRSEFPIIYNLEMRDWKAAAALEPAADARPELQTSTYWARSIAAGHLHDPQLARSSLNKYDALIKEVKNGKSAFLADSTFARIVRDEMLAWTDFAEGKHPLWAIQNMRNAADLQDKVGQGEVDIPAREMLADMLLEMHHPEQALTEYDMALKMSPSRFNGLFNAGRAAEESGDKARAAKYYAALLRVTNNGTQSARGELRHVKEFAAVSDVPVQ